MGSLDAFEANGIEVLRGMHVVGHRAISGEVRPASMTRVLGRRPSIEERVFLPPDAPALVLEWRAVDAPPDTFEVEWRILGVRVWRSGPRVLSVRLRSGHACRFTTSHDVTWSIAPDAGGMDGLAVTVRLPGPGGGPVCLVAVGARWGPDARSLVRRRLLHPEAQRIRALARVEERAERELRIREGEGRLGAALSWAAARMPPLSVSEAGSSEDASRPGHRLVQGLGALALGRFDVAEGRLSAAGPGAMALLARWRGDLASRATAAAPETLEEILVAGAGLTPLRKAAEGGPSRTVPLSLPESWTEAWTCFDRGETKEAHEALEALIRRGFADVAGAWIEGSDVWDHPTLTALVPATLVFGMLGARADAHFGRLRLAPQLPAGCTSLAVENLRVGGSRVSMDYRHAGAAHEFRLEQTEGAVPLNLIFEPTVPTAPVVRTEVDGQEAELETFSVHRRTGVGVHFPLDRPRSLAVVGSD